MNHIELLDRENEKREPKPCLGFRFTELEEIWICRAIRLSKVFMESYGRGNLPRVW